ncbi:hypothetical protein EKO29_02510 [Colwellia sp. Arc7-635]|jgi:predicted porin|uniref:porin n=1 Tax=Colwellia sp. Arc7-635 TaxID=2497879 RepID=UPI000F85518D|nr:porin [Colwellia sp. Arc7-635]AZQ83029.1 hypothetical protein EKO29_02510 [Colwellia sp. Arc7-635]
MKKTLLASSLMAAILSSPIQASNIDFSGYGSIRGGLLVNDDITPQYFGYDDKVDFKNESLFALQAKATLNDKWNATIVLQARGEEDFDLEARWAYLSYQYSPDTTISVGRFALPYFRNSDTQDVGYSHNYTRLPTSIYLGEEYDIIEGVRIMHTTLVGDGDITFKGSFGSFSGEVGGNDFELDNILQGSIEYTYEWFSVFAGVLSAEATFSGLDDFFDAGLESSLGGFGYQVTENGMVLNPGGTNVYDMNELYADEESTLYWTTGFTIDYENWLFNAEYATYEIEDAFTEETEAMYVSLGYRFDKAVVSFVHEDFKINSDYDKASSSDPFVNAFVVGLTDSLFKPDSYDAQGIHLRYDLDQGVALKFEYTVINNDLADESASLVTFGVDFIY